ncbi:MAG: helix-turn-helix domain-containing protein [Pyrinomonadaceae bacterium]
MSVTLGEKLRQAREAKGISIGEVAEQTRISPLYIESIDNDDYRGLPGGIFNRGFVKSYAKYVGVDEQEALSDYAQLLYEREGDVEDVKFHRPEVLTDDRAPASMLPTLIVAVVILAIMTVGVLFVLRQLQPSEQSANNAPTNVNSATTNSPAEPEKSEQPNLPPPPEMSTLKFEFKASNQPVPLTVSIDGQKARNQTITPGSTTIFEPKESVRFSYGRPQAQFVQMAINGKNITLPPATPQRFMIEFEINKQNLGQIWNSGVITNEIASSSLTVNANTGSLQAAPPRSNPPSNAAANPPAETRPVNTLRPPTTIRPSTPTRPANRPR